MRLNVIITKYSLINIFRVGFRSPLLSSSLGDLPPPPVCTPLGSSIVCDECDGVDGI